MTRAGILNKQKKTTSGSTALFKTYVCTYITSMDKFGGPLHFYKRKVVWANRLGYT